MAGTDPISRKVTPKRKIIRSIIILFGLLVSTIIGSAAYIAYQENKAITQYIDRDLETKLKVVVSKQNSEVGKLKNTIRIIREQNQKLADYLDYDQIKPVKIMLQNMSHIHSIDLICLFDENGNLLTTTQTNDETTVPSSYGLLIEDRQEKSGVEELPAAVLGNQFPVLKRQAKNQQVLCFKSIVHLLHDTGDICGFVVLVKLINRNKSLMGEMAEISGAQILYYDRHRNTVATSFTETNLPYPEDNIIKHRGKTYLVRKKDLTNFAGQHIGNVMVALNNKPFVDQRRWLLWNILIPFITSVILLLALFFILKKRVFDKIGQLIMALRSVTKGEGDLSVRIPVDSKAAESKDIDEVEHMMMDFNHMMDKMEEAHSLLRHEILERKHTEEELRESEEKYRSMMEAMNDAVYICSSEYRIKYMNPSMIKKVGGPNIGESCHKVLFDLDEKCTWCVFDRVQQGEHVEIELLNPKDKRYYGINNSPIFHTDGSISKLTIYRDITEIKEIEAQLQQAQRMEAIGTLAGGVAHDLNNILSGLVSYPDLLLMDLPEDSPLRTPILTIKKSGEKAAVVVQDLLTLSQRGIAVSEVVNLNTIISEQLPSPEMERLKLVHHKVEMEYTLNRDLLNIKGSPAHLSKAVMNLISNAAEAMPEGGTIALITENMHVDKGLNDYDRIPEGDYVALTISDNGIGISQEDINRIYEPFYTKKVLGREGTGLGMAVVWGTVKDHNGHIIVESAKGKGTVFKLFFPVCRETLSIGEFPPAIEEYMGNGESILVVDDVKEQREIASKILEKLGYSVKTVPSGEKAVAYMQSNTADLLILDMIMDPGINGLETYRKIIAIHPKQKAIIASGYSETEDVKAAQTLGAGQYVKKPYSLTKIGIAVRDALIK